MRMRVMGPISAPSLPEVVPSFSSVETMEGTRTSGVAASPKPSKVRMSDSSRQQVARAVAFMRGEVTRAMPPLRATTSMAGLRNSLFQAEVRKLQ